MSRALLVLSLCVYSVSLHAQSTFGTLLGTVKDPSGGVVANASVKVTNLDENTSRMVVTNSSGDYELVNSQPAHYEVNITAPGFRSFSATNLLLVARQTLRVDANLQLGDTANAITVEGSGAGVIATDTQTIQASIDSRELLNLPANIRANGNTSPYQAIQLLPGVQADQSGNFSIQGGIPSQTQYSVDGISITNVGGNQPLGNAFPSSESIAEIKVQGVGNQAEYGQVGDITVISKSGTNQVRGDLFWYMQNRALNALNFGQQTKPQLVANDFGFTVGGPVVIPHLYNGHDKTFFFGTYEGFRYPRATTIQNSVPTALERNGDFSRQGVTVLQPGSNTPFPNNVIPASQISSVAKGILALYPLPNSGNPNVATANNYIVNKDNSYSSNQFDVRVDQYLNAQQSFFARFTYKDINARNPQNLLVPTEDTPDNYKLFVAAHSWTIRPNLLNEARFGFTLNNASQTLPFDGAAFTNALGLQGIGPDFPFNGLPNIGISNYQSLDTNRGDSKTINDTWQFTDNTTWHRGRHTFKFGFDYKKIRAVSALGFTNGDNYGGYSFNGTFSGVPFADFLLGLPITTQLDDVKSDNDGRSNHYNAYAQDSFRVTPRLTLEFGVRWEFHPGYIDANGNIGNFDPSVGKSGAVIYPNGAEATLAPAYLQSFNACPTFNSTSGPSANGAACTPVLDARHAGYPDYLRNAPQRFLPRFGFAYRPFDDKTVFRGGFSVFNTEVLGSIYYALTGTLQSNTRTYNNIDASGNPLFKWPATQVAGLGEIAPLGTAYFGTANQLNWKDPYSMQWNFSIDRDLGFRTGLRVSYVGMATRQLVLSPNLNQSYYSTTYYVEQPLSTRPFPNWGTVNSRTNGANASYQSAQIEVTHRLRAGLALSSAYVLAKSLADNNGYANTNYAGENSGARSTDLYDLKREYGNVSATPRHHWVTSFVYDLPVGRGRTFGSHINRVVDAVAGGWQLASILTVQSGPFLTPYFSGGDPSGTGSGVIGRPQPPDLVGSTAVSNPNASNWYNVGAFACPGTPNWQPGTACLIGSSPKYLAPIGRFGAAGIGSVTGPGLFNLNAGLSKYFAIREHVRIKVEGSFTNVLNHLNLARPNLAIDSNSAGVITSAQQANFGGNRTGQVGARIEF